MQHWEVIKAGKVKVSETPEEFWENACAYFKWCDDNPLATTRTVNVGKKAGEQMVDNSIRPYSIKGLCLHCGVLEEWLKDIRETKDKESIWYNLISRILYVIYIQNLELATIGVFNPMFVVKVLNMEKEEAPNRPVQINIVQGLPELSESENEVLDKLEIENKDRES